MLPYMKVLGPGVLSNLVVSSGIGRRMSGLCKGSWVAVTVLVRCKREDGVVVQWLGSGCHSGRQV